MSEAPESMPEYPPASWITGDEFTAPGPLSRPVSDYLTMCAPRAPRASRANRFSRHAAPHSRPRGLRAEPATR
jgi:hypothetical protein